MGQFSLVVPEAATNLLLNPSIEENATSWVADSATISRVVIQSLFGQASLQLITLNAAATEGAYHSVNPNLANTLFTASIYIRRASGSGGTVRIRLRDVTNTSASSSATVTVTDKWQRISVSHTTGGTPCTDLRLYVETSPQQALTFFADGGQIEQAAYATTYVDGDQAGCEWSRAVHASTSLRSAQSRAGGRILDLDSYSVNVSAHGGMGMPPLQQIAHAQALTPGALFQGVKVQSRVILMSIWVNGTSFANLHKLRKDLIDAIKPDRVSPVQPFLLQYTGAGPTVEIPVLYEAGLEGHIGPKFLERIGLRLIAFDPFWRGVGEASAQLDINDSLSISRIAARIDGQWGNLGNPSASAGAGGTTAVYAAAIAPNGDLYLGGDFTNWDAIANADHIARWDGSAWSALSTGLNGVVRGMAFDAAGNLYVVGDFTDAGGDANADRIAKWNGSAFSALSANLVNGLIRTIAVAPNANIYIGGDFTSIGADFIDRIARWNGTAWSGLTSGLNNSCYTIAITQDGTIYVGGRFTTAGGSSANYIAKWNGTAWSALSTGMGGGGTTAVLSLLSTDIGLIYAAGDFTTAGGLTVNRITSWNGTAFSALSSGLDDNVARGLFRTATGLLYVVGNFTKASGEALASALAIWNGTAWAHPDIALPSGIDISVVIGRGTRLYIGHGASGTATAAGITTVTNNGTALSYPVVVVKRSGGTSAKLASLRNETTERIILLSFDLQDGETVKINLTPGARSIISDFRGNVTGLALLPNSDFSTFGLLPGVNKLSAFVNQVGSPTMTSYLTSRPRYWSADGVAV